MNMSVYQVHMPPGIFPVFLFIPLGRTRSPACMLAALRIPALRANAGKLTQAHPFPQTQIENEAPDKKVHKKKKTQMLFTFTSFE